MSEYRMLWQYSVCQKCDGAGGSCQCGGCPRREPDWVCTECDGEGRVWAYSLAPSAMMNVITY